MFFNPEISEMPKVREKLCGGRGGSCGEGPAATVAAAAAAANSAPRKKNPVQPEKFNNQVTKWQTKVS